MAVDLTGTVLGDRYRVLHLIGDGGMGRVYAAEHITLRRRVAIKVLRPEFSRDAAHVERFLQEAQAASAVSHKNVVDITDFGEAPDGTAFLVMEHLAGEELSELIRREAPLSWPAAQHIILQVVRGLNAAHQRGVIHRDMKPANVFIAQQADGSTRVKLLDFGIAKVARDGRRAKTRRDAVLGTAQYMSPEQASGGEVDARSDVYAVGVVLYEMLTGRPPFESDNVLEVAWKHVHAPVVPAREVAPAAGIPDVVDDLMMRALAKDPSERYPNMSEFEAAIQSTAFDGTIALANPLRVEDIDRTIIWADRGDRARAKPPPLPASADATAVRRRPAPTPPPLVPMHAPRAPSSVPLPAMRYVGSNPSTYPPGRPAQLPAYRTTDAHRTLPPLSGIAAANPTTDRYGTVGAEGAETAELILKIPHHAPSRNSLVILVAAIALVCVAAATTAWALFVRGDAIDQDVYPTVVQAQAQAQAHLMPLPTLLPGAAAEQADPMPPEPSTKVPPRPEPAVSRVERERARPRPTRHRARRRGKGRAATGLAGARPSIRACGRRHGAVKGTKLSVTFDVLGGRATSVTIASPHGRTPLGRCVARAIWTKARFSGSANAPNVSHRVAF